MHASIHKAFQHNFEINNLLVVSKNIYWSNSTTNSSTSGRDVFEGGKGSLDGKERAI